MKRYSDMDGMKTISMGYGQEKRCLKIIVMSKTHLGIPTNYSYPLVILNIYNKNKHCSTRYHSNYI